MNNYSDNTALYSDILQEDAVYNGLRRLERKVRDGRRKEKRSKEAKRQARYDQFWSCPLERTRCALRSIL